MKTHASEANKILIHKLKERVNKLDCFCPFADLTANPNVPFAEFIRLIADRVPMGFQTPESICACITVFNEIAIPLF